METILFVLANSAIAAVISSITAALVNKLQQDRGYKQDYYKEIISKRLRIYERIERQIAVLNSSIADVRPHHLFFENNIDGFHEYQRNLFYARSCGIWLSEEMNYALSELNKLFFRINEEISDDIDKNIELGQRYYDDIVDCRNRVANVLKNDLQNLYEVEKFLKKKKRKTTVTYYLNKD